MKIIHRYILRDLLAAFALALVALNVVLMTETVMRTSFMFAHVGASALDMALVVALIQPQTAVFTIPLALMVAIMMTYGRMNATSEIAVLRTGGMSLPSLARPASLLSMACLLSGLLLSCLIGPAAAKINNAHMREIISTRAPYAIEEGIFTSAFRDVVIFVEKKTGMDRLDGVFMHDSRDPRRPSVVTAREGRVESPEGTELRLVLTGGSMHLGHGGSLTDISFERYVMSVPIEARITRHKLMTAEMTPFEIIRALPSMNDPNQRVHATMELHHRFAIPLMSICVVLFSVPLSFRAGKTGKLGGIGLGLGMVVAFYVMSATMQSMFRTGAVPAAAAAWAPLLVLAGVSLYLYMKEAAR
jgi:lipopolysaccharide export system permease protein